VVKLRSGHISFDRLHEGFELPGVGVVRQILLQLWLKRSEGVILSTIAISLLIAIASSCG